MDESLVPAGTFIGPNQYDPLKQRSRDWFWHQTEEYFVPLQPNDLKSFEILRPNPHPEVAAPLAQRLVAALLDDGQGAMAATRALRTNITSEPMWLPGAIPALRSFNRIFESRVRTELEDLGVLRREDKDEELERLSLDTWHLHSLTASCAESVRKAAELTAEEVETQASRRKIKHENNLSEVKYLRRMMEVGAKRGKARFSRLLKEMHPNPEIQIGDPIEVDDENTAKGGAGGDSQERKKKKRKSGSKAGAKADAKFKRICKGADKRSIAATYNA